LGYLLVDIFQVGRKRSRRLCENVLLEIDQINDTITVFLEHLLDILVYSKYDDADGYRDPQLEQ
jgi:hypothetical protein